MRLKVEAILVSIFFSGVESLRMLIQNVAYVPTLKSHLISVSKAVEQGYKFGIDIPGLIMESKSTGDKILLPPAGGMYHSYGRRVADCELARAVITPGLLPTTDVDVNHYHRTTTPVC